MKSFEDLLRETYKIDDNEITPDFRISVMTKSYKGVHIAVSPINTSGSKVEFLVKGNDIADPYEKAQAPLNGDKDLNLTIEELG